MKDYMDCAVELAREAGKITLKHYGTALAVESKADHSPVTIADRSAEEYLRAEIEKRFPDDGILGEEYGVKPGTSGRRWILDPIDGTQTFIRGVPLYGTLIAVEVNEVPRVGVIHCPPLGETVAAYEGGGCFLNGERRRVSETKDLAEASLMTTALNSFVMRFGERALSEFVRRTKLQRTWGDCYGYMLVATGRADIMLDPVVARWDVAPMLPIVREAGGTITDIDGKTTADMGCVVAANPLLHAAAMELMRSAR